MKNISIHAIYGLIFAVLLVVTLITHKKCQPAPNNDAFYKKVIEQKDEDIDSIQKAANHYKKEAAKIPKEIIKIKKEYEIIYKDIEAADVAELDVAFDSLITN